VSMKALTNFRHLSRAFMRAPFRCPVQQ
jgi:hypothetical protein